MTIQQMTDTEIKKEIARLRRKARYWYAKSDHEASASCDELVDGYKNELTWRKHGAKMINQ